VKEKNCTKGACVLECGSPLPLFLSKWILREMFAIARTLDNTRDAYAPQNSLRRCKEIRGTATNGTNEPNRCCRHRLLFSGNSNPSRAAGEKSADARRCKEYRSRGVRWS